MTFTMTPPPPPAPTPYYNMWADFWFYDVGMSCIPSDTKKKKTWIKWSQYQVYPVSEEQFQEWKQQDAFKDGMAIIPGKVWRGPQKGNYLIFLDLDNAKAIQEFCTREGRTVPLAEIAKKFIVEQHLDDPTKCHIFFYSEIPFEKKSSDITDAKTPPDSIPAFEVKGKATHGIAYVTPSIHKNGHQHEIIGTTTPILLNALEAHGMMDHLDAICRKHKLKYLAHPGASGISYDSQNRSTYRDVEFEAGDNGDDDHHSNNDVLSDKTELNSAELSTDLLQEQPEITSYTGSASDLFKDGVVIYTGHNRHLALLRAMDKLLKDFHDDHTEEEIKEMAWKWNLKHCQDPLPEKDFEGQWKQAKDFISKKTAEHKEKERMWQQLQEQHRQKQQQQQQKPKQEQEQPKIELTEDLTREVSFDEIAEKK
jgi:hypothetical protein